MSRARILVVDDEQLIRTTLGQALAAYDVTVTNSVAQSSAALSEHRFDAAVVDIKLGDGSGLDVVRRLSGESPDTKSIVLTAHGNIDTAVAAMRLGAFDFIKKPFELEELLASVANALRAGELERRVGYHQARARAVSDEQPLIGSSPAMATLERELTMLAGQPVPVILILGETGSGKALVARRLHFASGRGDAPFVELNVATVPDALVESELFGHERGAFSDARERKPGLVEVADGGTLFLDEIGELSLAAQAKLLTFLESLTFRRLGGTASRTVDVRVVAATNRDLQQLVAAGQFRGDLYFRLNPITLKLPPLRARSADIAPLAQRFVRSYALKFGKKFSDISDEANAVLAAWRWPGNVRELKSVLQRAVLMNDGARLEVAHLPPELVAAAVDPIPADLSLSPSSAKLPTLDEIERRYMQKILALTGHNKARAAEHLGITRQTLAKRLGDAE